MRDEGVTKLFDLVDEGAPVLIEEKVGAFQLARLSTL
jgi:hypothetical protein